MLYSTRIRTTYEPFFLDDFEPSNTGEATPELPPAVLKDLTQNLLSERPGKPTGKKAKRKRDSIRERLNAYVRDYSDDLQELFDDIVATESPETKNNESIKPSGAQRPADQLRNACLAVYGSQYLKERLELMQKRSKISVMPFIEKKSKKKSLKRKSHASLLDKLQILRKKFQLIKKAESSVQATESSTNKKSRHKEPKKMKKKSLKKTKNKRKMKTKPSLQRRARKTFNQVLSRKANTNRKIRKKQGAVR